MHWMILPFKRYAEFSGRSRRMEFWMFTLMNTIIGLALTIPFLISFFGAALDPSLANAGDEAVGEAMLASMTGLSGVLLGLYFIYALAVLIPSLAVAVRRFHDIGYSGWVYVGLAVASIIPYIGFIASLAMIVMCFLPGNKGDNEYGPDPKNPYDEEVFA